MNISGGGYVCLRMIANMVSITLPHNAFLVKVLEKHPNIHPMDCLPYQVAFHPLVMGVVRMSG